jgi:hypothetical protein
MSRLTGTYTATASAPGSAITSERCWPVAPEPDVSTGYVIDGVTYRLDGQPPTARPGNWRAP